MSRRSCLLSSARAWLEMLRRRGGRKDQAKLFRGTKVKFVSEAQAPKPTKAERLTSQPLTMSSFRRFVCVLLSSRCVKMHVEYLHLIPLILMLRFATRGVFLALMKASEAVDFEFDF